ncbi:uncharacterized protein LOC120067628 [Benincasa hispida]|uniref:uncharacterized protein LOC120067628 n=1 Tax=Benincasa hispida TaxID=102211 RepID=UPI0019026C63|nr:uncharacterized protein LOC120067628 [Benincasa hispida]
MRMFRTTIFGPLLDVDLVFNGKLFYHFLLREVTDANPDVIAFNILKKKVKFFQDDFNLITGLWSTKKIVERETSDERLRQLILRPKDPNDKDSSCKDVENAFKKLTFTNDEDVVKVALALFIEIVMIEKDKKTLFDVKTFGIVDDPEVFRHYDWLSVFFKRTLNIMKTNMHGKKEAHETNKAENAHHAAYYCIKGFAVAF